MKAEKLVATAPASIIALKFISSLNYLLIGQTEGGVHVIDLKEGKEISYLKDHVGYIFALEYIKDKEELIIASGDGTISIWSLKSFKQLYKKRVGEKKIRDLAFSKKRNEMAVASGDGTVHFFNCVDWSTKFTISPLTSSVNTVVYDESHEHIIIGEKDAHLKVYDLNSKGIVHDIAAHYWAIYDLKFSPSQQLFATASRDKTVKIWDAANFKVLKRIEGLKDLGHTHSVNTLLWTSFHNYLISAGDDGKVKVWIVE